MNDIFEVSRCCRFSAGWFVAAFVLVEPCCGFELSSLVVLVVLLVVAEWCDLVVISAVFVGHYTLILDCSYLVECLQSNYFIIVDASRLRSKEQVEMILMQF